MFNLFPPSPIVDKAPRWGKRVAAHFPLVFGLSPFAHLFVCSREATHFGVIVTERPEIIELNFASMDDFVTNFLGNMQVRESFFRSGDYKVLVRRLGVPQPDECFYPVPYPAIGGS